VFADFVPLTVAGQRWLRTIFPGHGIAPRLTPTFTSLELRRPSYSKC
jgi:hypothetical protein